MAKIGFIGLGHMGLPMAINFLKAGHELYGFDVQSSARDALVQAGGRVAQSANQLATEKEVIITMLQTGTQLEELCLGKNGIFSVAASGTLFIDCSSIAVQSSKKIHQHAKKKGFFAVDAPVSGGVKGASSASLTFMIGSDDISFAKAEPYLKIMGQKIIRTGVPGSGQAAKLCNNMILGISMIAVSEAFTLAKALGLSDEKLFEVVNNSSGQCWAMSKYVPIPGLLPQVPANDDYKAGFSAKMMLKDLTLSQVTADTLGVKTTVAACATDIYQRFINNGQGDLDFSAIIKEIQNK